MLGVRGGAMGGPDSPFSRGRIVGSCIAPCLLTRCARSALSSLAATMTPGMCHATTCPLGLNDHGPKAGVDLGVESHEVGREPTDALSDPATLAAHSDRQLVKDLMKELIMEETPGFNDLARPMIVTPRKAAAGSALMVCIAVIVCIAVMNLLNFFGLAVADWHPGGERE